MENTTLNCPYSKKGVTWTLNNGQPLKGETVVLWSQLITEPKYELPVLEFYSQWLYYKS